ncbi:hypothetical protein ACOSQ3_031741 [Xanthoceras sorbifolium]
MCEVLCIFKNECDTLICYHSHYVLDSHFLDLNGAYFAKGMKSIGTSEHVVQGKSKQRRACTIFEEESFLTVLEDFVTNGKRCDTGNFKAGSLVQIEKALNEICHGSNLKATSHLESR